MQQRLGLAVADFAKQKQKTIRKQNGLGIFDTQSPSDVLRHPIGRTMIENYMSEAWSSMITGLARSPIPSLWPRL